MAVLLQKLKQNHLNRVKYKQTQNKMEKYTQLKEMINELEADVTKFYEKGNKSAAVRIRKVMQDVKNAAQEIRINVQETKNAA
jgi:hypothetical protein